MHFSPVWIIFMVGMIPFMAAYYPLKAMLPPWGFILAAFVYMVSVRLVSDWLADRFFSNSGGTEPHDDRD